MEFDAVAWDGAPMTSRTARLIAAFVAVGAVGLAPAPQASAHETGIHDNCTKFNQRFPHGVGRKHAVDKTSGTKVTNFKRSNKIYSTAVNHNPDLDRDGDKIACEKA